MYQGVNVEGLEAYDRTVNNRPMLRNANVI